MQNNTIDRPPDIEALFNFNGTRKRPFCDGYRPAHLVTEDYLTTGVHHYYEADCVEPDGIAKGTITFISPEHYPNCLWVGKKLNIQEGKNVVGVATVLKIFNPLLQADKQP